MGEEKRKRMKVAIIVNAVILICIIVAVIIYQIVTISSFNKRKSELYEEKARIERQYEGAEDILERLQNDEEYLKVLEALAKMGENAPFGPQQAN